MTTTWNPPQAPPRRRRALHAAGFVTTVLVAVALLTRTGALVGLAVVALLFVPIERLAPLHRERRVLRHGWRTDVVHFLVDRMLLIVATVAVVLTAGIAARIVTPRALRDAIAAWPLAGRAALAFVIAEVGTYWGHRLAHEVPFLWRFHRVHHSSAQLDWLASARVHPIDQAVIRSFAIVPLFALGYQGGTLGALLMVFTLQALFIHANVRWTFGPLRYVLATPQFHHWHHANDPEHRNTNFAGELPVLDAIFGTLHVPSRAWPAAYGIDEPMPDGYLAQLASPWK